VFDDTKGLTRIRIYRRRTDITMAKRNRTKGQTTIYKTYTLNKRSSSTNSTQNPEVNSGDTNPTKIRG